MRAHFELFACGLAAWALVIGLLLAVRWLVVQAPVETTFVLLFCLPAALVLLRRVLRSRRAERGRSRPF
jgi:hypothetical protein